MSANEREFRPFTGPLFRAMELQSYIEDIKFRREAQAHQREAWKAELDQRKRTSAFEDYIARMTLMTHGAMPVGPNDQQVEGSLDSAFGPVTPETRREAIDTPVGRYRLPSAVDRSSAATKAALEAGRVAGITERTKQDIVDPNVRFKIPTGLPEISEVETSARESKKHEILKAAFERTHPKHEISWADNDVGDRTYIATNPVTLVQYQLRTVKGMAKTKSEPAGDDKLPAIPEIFKVKADTAARAALRAQFPSGKRESEEFKSAVEAKAQDYLNDPEGGTAGSMEVALRKARNYFTSGKGKGSVERWQKLEDSDEYRDFYNKKLSEQYGGYQGGREAKRSGGSLTKSSPRVRTTITQAEYDELVRDSGKAATDAALKAEGITVK